MRSQGIQGQQLHSEATTSDGVEFERKIRMASSFRLGDTPNQRIETHFRERIV
jgi:hypothetical protein